MADKTPASHETLFHKQTGNRTQLRLFSMVITTTNLFVVMTRPTLTVPTYMKDVFQYMFSAGEPLRMICSNFDRVLKTAPAPLKDLCNLPTLPLSSFTCTQDEIQHESLKPFRSEMPYFFSSFHYSQRRQRLSLLYPAHS